MYDFNGYRECTEKPTLTIALPVAFTEAEETFSPFDFWSRPSSVDT